MMLCDASAATAPLIAAAATIAPPFAAPALALLAAAGVEVSRSGGGGAFSPQERDPIVAASLEYVDPAVEVWPHTHAHLRAHQN